VIVIERRRAYLKSGLRNFSLRSSEYRGLATGNWGFPGDGEGKSTYGLVWNVGHGWGIDNPDGGKSTTSDPSAIVSTDDRELALRSAAYGHASRSACTGNAKELIRSGEIDTAFCSPIDDRQHR
jgi:hypothetical protein